MAGSRSHSRREQCMTREDDIAFQKVVTEGLVPKIEGSGICVAICPDDEGLDAKFCVELGVMIMLDKPIVVALPEGRSLPRKLEMVADKIVHGVVGTPGFEEAFKEALSDLGLDMSGGGEEDGEGGD